MTQRRPHKPTGRGDVHPREPQEKPPAEAAAAPSAPTLSRRRRWAYRILAATLIPALLLGLLEAGLRLGGYGYGTGFFINVPGRNALAGNPKFGWRFFPPSVARMPLPFVLPATKSPETYRIFVLGSSAAQGFPEPSFGFARILEVMLREAFPKRHFEVVNTAMIAVNSHVVVPVACDCAKQQPDLYIVYEGNNEVVGPFGPGTVFRAFSGNLGLIRGQLALGRSRLVQLLQNLAGRLHADDTAFTEWRGMEFFLNRTVPLSDPRLEDVYAHFRKNLLDICSAGRGAGADVLLCTVGVNLKDCPPFASLHRFSFSRSEDDQARWMELFQEGVRLEAANQPGAAIEAYLQAIDLDDRYAELYYRLARCHWALEQYEDAASEFALARDLDGLRFRTDSRLNEVIRQAAKEAGDGVRLIDVERLMQQAPEAAHGVPGDALFYEHCHMTFAGNYRIAAALFAEIAPRLEGSSGDHNAATPTPAPMERCAELLGRSGYHEYSVQSTLVGMLSAAPFTGQLDHEQRLANARDRLESLRVRLQPDSLARDVKLCERAIAAAPDDPLLHRGFTSVLIRQGDLRAAAAQLRKVLEVWPFDPQAHQDLGNLMLTLGSTAEAEKEYQAAAESVYCDASCQAEAHFNLGIVAEKRNDVGTARSHYEKALRFRPNHLKAHGNLGVLLAKAGEHQAALEHHRRSVELAPEVPLTRLNLGLALVRVNRLEEAVEQFEALVRLAPGDASGYVALGDVLNRLNRSEEALTPLERAVELAPNSAEVHNALGSALFNLGRRSEAKTHFDTAVRLKPDFAEARRNLQAAQGQP